MISEKKVPLWENLNASGYFDGKPSDCALGFAFGTSLSRDNFYQISLDFSTICNRQLLKAPSQQELRLQLRAQVIDVHYYNILKHY